ncbi:roundabout homolog 1 isoform X2 [Periophthalmus magnuspinnatus]|uniref:roundabout homolog 1 isoform X2 n=1 Tax=Periophthalmus magnuspinnatus TaxID=409849 RepID=UPI0024364E8C|nr:roundabout homolog 1 isoform X2 [Periophthalmus magnuspinnatus]
MHHGIGDKHTAPRSHGHRRKGLRVRAEETPPRIVHHPSDLVVRVGSPATLSCRADGNPKPTIEWLQDGVPVHSELGDSHLQPIVLSEGSIFFLSVTAGRRGLTHEGVYTCVATNSVGKATSRNASLYIAALQEEFGAQPGDVEVSEGEVAVLTCVPPMGHPEPNVYWRRDGLPINKTDQHYTELSGKLIIAPADRSHSGAYVCVASNTVGVRESRAARLTVLEKPVLLQRPQNVSVKMGESAHFTCQAKGDPAPVVMWSRDQGPLPNGRYLVNPVQTLQIHYVTAQDAGTYTCTAVNDAGVVTASAQLTVQGYLVPEPTNSTQKDFHKELSSLRVVLESVVILAAGSNKSLVQWRSFSAQPHFLDGFEVLYRSLLPASSDWAAKKVLMPGFQAQIGPLKRGFKYEFKVRPYGSNLYGRESNTRHLRVPETVPSAPPVGVSLSVNHEQNNSVSLNWEAPPHDTHNGIIQGYQIWCVDSDQQQYQNWTVDSSREQLLISGLRAGARYWVSIAAVNGAGVGMLSEPQGFVINPPLGSSAENDGTKEPPSVLSVLRDPVVIGSIGALLWCVLMIAVVCLYRRHSRTGQLIPMNGKRRGLHRLAGEDLIIKHRMAAPDSPWIAGGWRQGHFNEYQDLWAQSHKNPKLKSASEWSCVLIKSLPASSSKDSNSADSVPIVTDSCGVYGTFYVDLSGRNLKTFNSPGKCPRMPHNHHGDQGTETIKIFTQPVSKGSPLCTREPLPWKQGIRPQPRMGISHSKQDLHTVNSVPLISSKAEICSSDAYRQRQSQGSASKHSGQSDLVRAPPCPRLLHYSTSVHLVDMLPPPPPLPIENTAETHSFSSDEGSSHSTKLTGDMGSLQSVNTPPATRLVKPNANPSNYSRQSTASYCMTLHPDPGAMTAQEATQYLELSPKPERCSLLPEQNPSLPHPVPHSLGFISSSISSQPDLYSTLGHSEAPPAGLRRARVQSSPSSCYSEWDSSLWNTWSSVMDRDMERDLTSARTSLISSVDSCYTTDSAHFARLLAVAAAAESMSGASLSDFSPPASPLSVLYPSYHLEGDSFGDLDPVPAWDWKTAWMEEMEEQYKNHYNKPFDC